MRLITSDQLRTKDFRVTQIQAPGFDMPLLFIPDLVGKYAFEYAGPGWSGTNAQCVDTIEDGLAFMERLQLVFDIGGAASVRQFVNDCIDRERRDD